MGAFKDVQDASRYFKDDRFATENGIEITEITDEHAVARLVVQPHHLNANHMVMGGAIFTLADLALSALGCNLHLPVVGTDCNIHYLSPGREGDTLYATARCLKNGRTTVVMESDVTNQDGKRVAHMTGTAFKIYPKE